MEYILVCLTATLVCGYISRMTGGAPPKLPRVVDMLLWGLPLGAASLLFVSNIAFVPFYVFAAAVWGLSALAKAKGHAYGQRMGRNATKPGPSKALAALFMAGSGALLMLPISLAAAWFVSPWYLLMLLIGAIAKPLSYEISWQGADKWGFNAGKYPFRWGTEVGEFLTGALIGLGTAISVLFIM